MGISYSPRITTENLCFYFDALNIKCYSGTGATFTDLISQKSATAVITSPATLGIVNGNLRFVPGATTRTAYVPFASADVTVPTGQQGSWMWFQKWEDQGSIDHPNIGKEAGGGWDGQNGFVFGTGWGTDGPRWGIGGTAYGVYESTPTDYVANIWQCWAVTYNGGSGNNPNGLKTYLNGIVIDSRTAVASTIGSNSNNLHIGSTNSRGGNWGGYMDNVLMWTKELTSSEIYQNFQAFRGRYGL
jgi:hypothetical protein